MSKSIRLHPEFGVNPMLYCCSVCGNDIGVALLGYNGGKEAPRKAVLPGEICDPCIGYMKVAVAIIECRDGESGKNPYRTGRLFYMKDEAFARIFSGPEAEAALKARVTFMEESLVKKLGLDQVEPEIKDRT